MTKQPQLTVVICTRNPRQDYLARTLKGLAAQTLPQDDWEFLLVDNGSTPPLDDPGLTTWHVRGRRIVQPEAGLTRARLTAIQHARGELIVFVDDDNVLAPDFLDKCRAIAIGFPQLGVFGGAIAPEFESPPEPWTRSCWEMLAIRELETDVWSNFSGHHLQIPCGAGMCLRTALAKEWASRVLAQPLRLALGRRGASLSAGEDNDIVRTVYACGFGSGVFRELKLSHLIPSTRLEEDYLLRLAEAISYSQIVLNVVHGDPVVAGERPVLARLMEWRRSWRKTPFERKMAAVQRRGMERAIRDLRSLGQGHAPAPHSSSDPTASL